MLHDAKLVSFICYVNAVIDLLVQRLIGCSCLINTLSVLCVCVCVCLRQLSVICAFPINMTLQLLLVNVKCPQKFI